MINGNRFAFVQSFGRFVVVRSYQASGIGNRGAYCCRVVELFEAGTLTRGKILPWIIGPCAEAWEWTALSAKRCANGHVFS